MSNPVPDRPGFPMNISVQEARTMLADLLPTLETELVGVGEAAGRFLAEDLEALVSHPAPPRAPWTGSLAGRPIPSVPRPRPRFA